MSFLLIPMLVGLGGCATIFKGTSQEIFVNSDPARAQIIVKTMKGEDAFRGATPATMDLDRSDEYIVTIRLAGYRDNTVLIHQDIEGWWFGNLLCGGIIGGAIDALDGAMWKLNPRAIQVTLERMREEAPSTNTGGSTGGSEKIHIMMRATDSDGQLRSLAIPMVRDNELALAP